MITTDTYWDVDGTPLQTLAYNIVTLGGDRMMPPGLRGKDLTIPYAPGDVHQKKVVDSRTITLGMWVQGVDTDGLNTTLGARRQFDANWKTLKHLLWTPRRQVVLTKRFYDGSTLKTASAKAQFGGGMIPVMQGPARATFTVDLVLADPYFYGVEENTTLTTGTQVVSVDGDDVTRAVKFQIRGARKNVKIRNNTLGVQVEYRGDLRVGDEVRIDVKKFTSVTDPVATAEFNSVGSVLHDGDAFWFLLAPGNNSITVSSDTGAGNITMTHQEAWL